MWHCKILLVFCTEGARAGRQKSVDVVSCQAAQQANKLQAECPTKIGAVSNENCFQSFTCRSGHHSSHYIFTFIWLCFGKWLAFCQDIVKHFEYGSHRRVCWKANRTFWAEWPLPSSPRQVWNRLTTRYYKLRPRALLCKLPTKSYVPAALYLQDFQQMQGFIDSWLNLSQQRIPLAA